MFDLFCWLKLINQCACWMEQPNALPFHIISVITETTLNVTTPDKALADKALTSL